MRRAGSLVLLSGCDGETAPDAAHSVLGQCEHVYRTMTAALAGEGLAPSAMVRLDHFTQSQGWLADRQGARAAAFGRPAALASTGVGSLHRERNLLTATGIAWGGVPDDKQVAVAGADFGMPAIATAVRAGPWVFISGLLTSDPSDAVAQLGQVLERVSLDGNAIVRLDRYVSAQEQWIILGDLVATRLTEMAVARTGAVLPFGAAGQLEVTTLASSTPIRRHGLDGVVLVETNDLVFTGAIDAGSPGSFAFEVARCVDRLAAYLQSIGRSIAHIARLEVCLADPAMAEAAEARLRERLAAPLPALTIWAGGGLGPFHLTIAAIGT